MRSNYLSHNGCTVAHWYSCNGIDKVSCCTLASKMIISLSSKVTRTVWVSILRDGCRMALQKSGAPGIRSCATYRYVTPLFITIVTRLVTPLEPPCYPLCNPLQLSCSPFKTLVTIFGISCPWKNLQIIK